MTHRLEVVCIVPLANHDANLSCGLGPLDCGVVQMVLGLSAYLLPLLYDQIRAIRYACDSVRDHACMHGPLSTEQ